MITILVISILFVVLNTILLYANLHIYKSVDKLTDNMYKAVKRYEYLITLNKEIQCQKQKTPANQQADTSK